MVITVTHCITTSKERACSIICILYQHTSPNAGLENANMSSYCDVTKSVYPVTMTTVRHCSKLEFGRGHTIKQIAPGITRPLHATDNNLPSYQCSCYGEWSLLTCNSGADPGGGRLGWSPSLKPAQVTLFIMTLYHSKNSIRHIRLFCHQLFCHSSVVKYASSLWQTAMRLDYQILLKSPPLTLLVGSAPAVTWVTGLLSIEITSYRGWVMLNYVTLRPNLCIHGGQRNTSEKKENSEYDWVLVARWRNMKMLPNIMFCRIAGKQELRYLLFVCARLLAALDCEPHAMVLKNWGKLPLILSHT